MAIETPRLREAARRAVASANGDEPEAWRLLWEEVLADRETYRLECALLYRPSRDLEAALDEILADTGWDFERALNMLEERTEPRENPSLAAAEREALGGSMVGPLAQMIAEEAAEWRRQRREGR